ncbi:MAG: hypothetical protein NTX65_12895 [Ignavibacteriales bacterium]|nr:hypothetical protein [Ignavibacteriales bacterium]
MSLTTVLAQSQTSRINAAVLSMTIKILPREKTGNIDYNVRNLRLFGKSVTDCNRLEATGSLKIAC